MKSRRSFAKKKKTEPQKNVLLFAAEIESDTRGWEDFLGYFEDIHHAMEFLKKANFKNAWAQIVHLPCIMLGRIGHESKEFPQVWDFFIAHSENLEKNQTKELINETLLKPLQSPHN